MKEKITRAIRAIRRDRVRSSVLLMHLFAVSQFLNNSFCDFVVFVITAVWLLDTSLEAEEGRDKTG